MKKNYIPKFDERRALRYLWSQIFYFILLDFLFYAYECLTFMFASMCARCLPGILRDQKWVLDSLILELQMVLSHHVGIWNLI